tara:strand:+ start:251 stop:664 length:414 start_codon:yes stop_codon:yes gene_type:complete
MSTINLIKSFIEEDENNFKDILGGILEKKINEKKQNIVFETTKKIFEHEENLNNVKPDYEVINVLRECDKQNSNISIILKDGKDSMLKPDESRKVLLVFDNLNETNQVRLINRLVESRANFHNTIEFCTKFKERYNQ